MTGPSAYGKHSERPMAGARSPYITTTYGSSGHFAVMLWWNPDLGGFWEPWTTGTGRYASSADAVVEGREWAEAEGLEFKNG